MDFHLNDNDPQDAGDGKKHPTSLLSALASNMYNSCCAKPLIPFMKWV